MSKIQFNELNTSELEVLNTEETSEVVGGFFLSYTQIINTSFKSVALGQGNSNSNSQAALSSGFAFTSNGNSNSTNQSNNAAISQ